MDGLFHPYTSPMQYYEKNVINSVGVMSPSSRTQACFTYIDYIALNSLGT